MRNTLTVFVATLLLAGCGGSGGNGSEDVQPDTQDVKWMPEFWYDAPTGEDDQVGEDIPSDVPALACDEDLDCEGQMTAAGEGVCAPARCNLETGVCELATVADGEPCDDDNPCTTESECQSGRCIGVADALLDCTDGNPCTDDSCDPATGCVYENNRNGCDDGRSCTDNDRCSEGACVGVLDDCDDGNPCTDEVCLEGVGCSRSFNTAPCDDGNACTANDHCVQGACQGGVPVTCNDNNACTNDSCHSIQGCRHTFNEQPCDDGNPCTDGDRCGDGTCRPGSYTGACPACTTSDDCLPYDDGNACNGRLACTGGQCLIDSATVVTCTVSTDPCARTACNPQTGECETTTLPNGEPCSDGDACTLNDICAEGVCEGTAAQCDDNNPCTTSACVAGEGCQHTPEDGGDCEDGNPCTTGDYCEGGGCRPGPDFVCISCADDSECRALDDDDLCNGVLRCIGGACQVDPATVVTCDTSTDGACRQTLCQPTSGACVQENRPDGTPCDDTSACTSADACTAGTCRGVARSCDDGIPCTVDSCLPSTGECQHVPSLGDCEDGNPCTEGDYCEGTRCIAGGIKECDDEEECTADYCDAAAGGCVFEPRDRDCDDDDPCTLDDACVEGVCTGTPVDCDDGEQCTQDTCDGVTGMCRNTQVAGPCDDGDACTEGDSCVSGACRPGSPVTCDDGNPCTANACNPATGCDFSQPTPADCSDNDACTTGDHCEGVECVPSGTLECDDGNICTTDSCDAAVGCVFTPNSDPCDDENACTTNDTCVDRVCTGGPPLVCDDEDVCTDNVCVPAEGCTYPFNSAPCDDGNACTDPDTCNAGVCVGGPIVCTEDNCGDEIDNDTDGQTDCYDPDCNDVPPCLPCTPATTLSCGDGVSGTLFSPLATDDLDSYSCSELGFSGREFAYTFVSDAHQVVQVQVTTNSPSPSGTGFAKLHVFAVSDDEGRCSPLNCTAHGAPVQSPTRATADLSFGTIWDTTTYLVVDGEAGVEATYQIFVHCTPIGR